MLLLREDHGAVVILSVQKARIDAESASHLGEEARPIIAATQGDCVIDLDHVTFLDSSGIGMLVGLLKAIGQDRRLILCGLAPAVQRVMKLTRLDAVFLISESVSTALADLDQPHSATG